MNANLNTIKDFDQICRICLKEQSCLMAIRKEFLQYLTEIAGVKVAADDGLPQNLCVSCSSNLQQLHAFFKQIQKSNITLNKTRYKLDKVQDQEYNSNNVEISSIARRTPRAREHLCKKLQCFTCNTCTKIFSCKAKLTRHEKSHAGINKHICEKCGNAYRESGSLKKHVRAKHSNREKPYKCDQCNLAFNAKSTLLRHITTHTGERLFGCDICQKFYPSKSYLNRHKKIHTTASAKTFTCNICNKHFAIKDGLKAHLLTHSNNKLHNCDICNKDFTTKGSLKSHNKYIHTKEKRFMCQYCGKTFVTQFELKKHAERHTGMNTKRMYKCKMCAKILHSSTHLKFHMRSEHTDERPYDCDLCQKNFFTSQLLKIHKRLHTGERPYTCNYCSKSFVTKGNLMVHKRIHTGERPHSCWICGITFSQSSTLRTHMKNH